MSDIIDDDPLIIQILKQEAEERKNAVCGIMGGSDINPNSSKSHNDRYLLTIYETNNDYKLSLKNTSSLEQYIPKLVDFDDDGLQYLWEYAYLFFETNINPDDYITRDLTYQEFSNLTRCKIVVNNFNLTTYNPKYNTSADMKSFVIVINPPVNEIKKILVKPPCIVNFIFYNGTWIAKRKIIKHMRQTYKQKKLLI